VTPTEAWTTPVALRRERTVLASLVIVSLAAFAVLTAVVASHLAGTSLDLRLEPWLFDLTRGSSILTALGRLLNIVGGDLVSIVIVTFVAVTLLVHRHRLLTAYLVVSAIGGVLLTTLVKGFVDQPRPPTMGILLYESTSSYPSGHATSGITTYVALAVVALVTQRREIRWWLAMPVASLGVLIGISRVALGVHWPTDVMAGWALGTAWTSLVALVIVLVVLRRARTADRRALAS
jgi:membrane-associated phospholipid phosphatase